MVECWTGKISMLNSMLSTMQESALLLRMPCSCELTCSQGVMTLECWTATLGEYSSFMLKLLVLRVCKSSSLWESSLQSPLCTLSAGQWSKWFYRLWCHPGFAPTECRDEGVCIWWRWGEPGIRREVHTGARSISRILGIQSGEL